MPTDTQDDAHLIRQATAWIARDPDPETRAELQALIDARALDELRERFAAPLDFGTAGLRGLIGAGLGRMNVANVAWVSAGFARQLLGDVEGAAERGVVVGRDARHGSDVFARVAAEVFVAAGLPVVWVPRPSPTPLVAFIGRHRGAAGVALVTASHNPPEYNGFKVYGPRGSQIVPPQDRRIREARDAITDVSAIARVPFTDAVADGRIVVAGEADYEAYFAALDAQCMASVPPPAQVSAVTTALHGVGHAWVHDALARRGHRHVFPVLAQAAPDPDFPTVRFPNPEEDGALDLAIARARRVHAELILANDPDTDRLCVAVRDEAQPRDYRVLTGNELGILLADWILGEGARLGRLPERPLVLASIVSTTMLERLAEARGAVHAEALTGFKWIWDAALARAERGETFVFGFEEALGYCCGPAVRDKDGIGAAQVLMELAASLEARGMTLLDRMAELEAELGAHVTDQVSVVWPGIEGRARIARVMARFRGAPPERVAGVEVARALDLAGEDADALSLPRADVLIWRLSDGGRVIVRPSGTEPKLKCYLEVRCDAADVDAVPDARSRGREAIERMGAWMREAVEAIA